MTPASELRVLVIDDEKNIRETLTVCLEQAGCEVHRASSGASALDTLARFPFDLAFLDLRLGTERGEDLIPRLVALSPGLPIVVITAYATVETAVETLRRGAWDYLAKPFAPAQIRQVLSRIKERRHLTDHVAELERQLEENVPAVELSSDNAGMRKVMEVIERAAQSDAPVLFRGETGTGKTALARAVHMQSARRRRPFVVVNCPTLSEELLASELFGHARGAFTGAVKDQPGRVESASGGTLFLDEIGEIPSSLQAKLLRFLQDKQFERVGDNETRHADVRIVAASNRDIEEDIGKGLFRQDLLFRLNVLEIRVPPLRERPEDILPLARHFVPFFAAQLARPSPQLSPDAEALLVGYSWPGNVRELRNAIERALILWPTNVIEPEAFPERMTGSVRLRPVVGGDFALEDIEREHILRVLQRAPTLDRAAEILKIDSTTLWRKRKKYE
ncbi:MAG TPA: sigma-54 dependent transcriptional regulator [Polyangia bacterium]|jgi:NtrC-family two-component system response regulator AlgB|nr:sigma-54 dependent transcriptional regulator [Polyangia bacterium]